MKRNVCLASGMLLKINPGCSELVYIIPQSISLSFIYKPTVIKYKKGYLGLIVNEEATVFAKLFWGEVESFLDRFCVIVNISTLCFYNQTLRSKDKTTRYIMQNLTLAKEDLNILKIITSSTQWKTFTARQGVFRLF